MPYGTAPPPAWTIAGRGRRRSLVIRPARRDPRRWWAQSHACRFPRVSGRARAGRAEDHRLDVGTGRGGWHEPRGHAMLYETGPRFVQARTAAIIIAPYLRAAGVRRPSTVSCHHDDFRSSGGAVSVLPRYVAWLVNSRSRTWILPLLRGSRVSLEAVRRGVDARALDSLSERASYALKLKDNVPEARADANHSTCRHRTASRDIDAARGGRSRPGMRQICTQTSGRAARRPNHLRRRPVWTRYGRLASFPSLSQPFGHPHMRSSSAYRALARSFIVRQTARCCLWHPRGARFRPSALNAIVPRTGVLGTIRRRWRRAISKRRTSTASALWNLH